MKCVGIIGAMEQEVARLKEVMEDVSITTRANMDFYEGVLEGKKVVVVQSGIGKVNAGMCTQILADLFQVEAVIVTASAMTKMMAEVILETTSISEISYFLQMFFIMIWMLQDLDIRRDRFLR